MTGLPEMTGRRVALVTGAGRGIGAATVRQLAEQGWAVVAVDSCTDDPALPYPMSSAADLDAVVADATLAAAPGDWREAGGPHRPGPVDRTTASRSPPCRPLGS